MNYTKDYFIRNTPSEEYFYTPVNTNVMKHPLLGIGITLGSYKNFINSISDLARTKQSEYICVANVHMLVEAHNDITFASVVNEAIIVTPDGMPLVIGLKLLAKIKQDRVAGMDLLPDMLAEAEKSEFSVFFYGGSEEMATKTKEFVNQKYPKLKLADVYSPPFRPLTTEEEDADIEMINNSGSNLLFVALGCPKQEKWMARMKGKINMPMIGIGGALPVMIGLQKRAPAWIQNNSLEWAYRLTQEPIRLFKRYASTNSIFLWLFFKELIQKNLKTTLK